MTSEADLSGFVRSFSISREKGHGLEPSHTQRGAQLSFHTRAHRLSFSSVVVGENKGEQQNQSLSLDQEKKKKSVQNNNDALSSSFPPYQSP